MSNVTSKHAGAGGATGPNDQQARDISAAQPSRPTNSLETVVFIGAGSKLVPIKKRVPYMEGGIQKFKEIIEKVPVDFPEADKRRAIVTNPDVIEYLRAKGHQEVSQSVLDEEYAEFRRLNRSSNPSFGAMEEYVNERLEAVKDGLLFQVSDVMGGYQPPDLSNVATVEMIAALHKTIDTLTDGFEALIKSVESLKSELSASKGRITKLENAAKGK